VSVGETMPRENVTAVNRQHPRVLHLSLVPRINQGSGILQQLLLERGAAQSLGIPWSTELFAPHAPFIDAIGVPNRAPEWLQSSSGSSLLARAKTSRQLRNTLYKWMSTVQNDYDVVLLRYITHDRRLASLMRRSPSMMGLVHHACEVPELVILDSFVGKARGFAEHVFGRRAIAQADVLLAVTTEIAEYELSRIDPKKIPTLIYPNGGPSEPSPVTDRRDEVPQFLFVASHFSPWQGLDRLLKSLQSFDGDLVLHLVGTMEDVDLRRAQSDPRIIVHGVADQTEIRRIAEPCWAGISSLATDRQGLRVACPLKVREYFAMELPAVGLHREELPSDFAYYAMSAPDIASIIEKAREWRMSSRTQIAAYATSVVSKEQILSKTYKDLTNLWVERRRS